MSTSSRIIDVLDGVAVPRLAGKEPSPGVSGGVIRLKALKLNATSVAERVAEVRSSNRRGGRESRAGQSWTRLANQSIVW
jgi:hypothetical protein